MRTGDAIQHERIIKLFDRNQSAGVAAGLLRVRVEDEKLVGQYVTVKGRRLLNFGSCAYLGLNLDDRLKAGAIDAIERYGPVFSSSGAYTSIDLYSRLETQLEEIFEAAVIVPTTTTLGHLSALPLLIGAGDAVVVDAQAHSSIHLATQSLIAEGIPVRVVDHNDLEALDAALADLVGSHNAVWYLADGVYSMYGDVAPVDAISSRLDRYDNLYVYIDDAHGFGWTGSKGRGFVLEGRTLHERMVVAVSLSKSFGSGGAAIAFPNRALADRVQRLGGTMTFSGPLHPAELGAAIASAEIHLSDEHAHLMARIDEQIEYMAHLIKEFEIPAVSIDHTPIWFAHIGGMNDTLEVAQRLLADGFYCNYAVFPAVPVGHGGIRFTQTLYHSEADLAAFVECMAGHIADVVDSVDDGIDITVDLSDAADLASEHAIH
ncbi:MAG: aminotransferase class I/II-fold pyridoxal phosphate-dependent enzyme [Acidimicrobiia bacterium]|nr:aminotransferase class I/II-fold pyridoxal phosphate-dependent enzyme [Acidimicrobiia bacterium]